MALRAYKPGELFRRPTLARLNQKDEEGNIGLEASNRSFWWNRSSERPRPWPERFARQSQPLENINTSSNKSRGESSAKKAKKWAWTPEAAEVLFNYVSEFKMKCFDFEADPQDGFRFPRLYWQDSPRDNPTHAKKGYLLTLQGG